MLANQNNSIFDIKILTAQFEVKCVARLEYAQDATINIFDKEARHLETVKLDYSAGTMRYEQTALEFNLLSITF